MKLVLSFASVLILSVAPAFAGDGALPQHSLAKMGLGGMKALSDRDGMAIRGQFAFAFSSSFDSKGTSYTIVSKPVGAHFAVSATVAIGGGLFAGGGASATSH
jgi:hypothetical protein